MISLWGFDYLPDLVDEESHNLGDVENSIGSIVLYGTTTFAIFDLRRHDKDLHSPFLLHTKYKSGASKFASKFHQNIDYYV